MEIVPDGTIGCLGSGCEMAGRELVGVVLVVGTARELGIGVVAGGTGKVVPGSGAVVGGIPERGLAVGNGIEVPTGVCGKVSGDDNCGVGEGLRARLLFGLGVTVCAICGSSERLSICTIAAVKPTPSSNIAAMLAQVVDGAEVALVGRLKAGVVNTSAAYSSKTVAKSNSWSMVNPITSPVSGVARLPKNR